MNYPKYIKVYSVLLDTLIKSKLFIVIYTTELIVNLTNINKKLMQENFNDYEFCIKVALDNANKRINLLDNLDKKCVLDEYKEWINDGVNNHKVLILREDPII